MATHPAVSRSWLDLFGSLWGAPFEHFYSDTWIDDGVEAFTWISEGKARAKATLHIEDLADELGIELSEDHFEDVDTIGGLMAQKLGRVPIAGSTITVGDYLITSERPVGRRRRISSVLIEKIESAGNDKL